MEHYYLIRDMKLVCVKAHNFPDGINDAFDELESLHPSIGNRDFFGLSYLRKDPDFIYKVGVQEMFDGEAEDYGCETFTLEKGEYITETLINWRENETAVGNTFLKLLKDPRKDLNYPCIEWYISDSEMMCMIKIANADDEGD